MDAYLPVNPFRSFWMGGFECTDQLNKFGDRVDLINTTQHLDLIYDDYQRLSDFNILTVREGIRWSFVERVPCQYDFTVVKKMLDAGKACGIQQVWDICHFGYPNDLSPLHPHFAERFESLCVAFVNFYRSEYPNEPLIITPINEVSFISWLGGEACETTPFCKGYGWPVKYALMRAYIRGIKAMKAIDPSIKILTTEPIVNIVPPLFATEEQIIEAAKVNDDQYQAVDILFGRICPELGGSPELVDILGFNFYYNNQWVTGFEEFLPWFNEDNDPRWKPLRDLLTSAYRRYGKPIALTETSHPGVDRPGWIDFIGKECAAVCAAGVPLYGVCLYPIVDRPDWNDTTYWHHSGLWDTVKTHDETAIRALNVPYAEALLEAQRLVRQTINTLSSGVESEN